MDGLVIISLDYIEIMRYIIALLSAVLVGIYFYDGVKQKNPLSWLMGFSRLFVTTMYVCFLVTELPPNTRILLKDLSIIILLLPEVIGAITLIMTRKFKSAIELEHMKRALVKMADKNHFIVESCPVGIYQYSCTTFKFVYVNPQFASYFKQTPSFFIGKSIFYGMPDKQIVAIQDSVRERLAGNDMSIITTPLKITTDTGKQMELNCRGRIVYNGEACVLGYATLVE
jgi:hypothetical protein